MRAIRFERVAKQYPGTARPAVREVSFEVAPGALVALVGPSGSGKTTLLKMVNRLVEPDAGAVRVDETDVRGLDPVALRRQIGYVIQQPGLFPHMSVAANVAVVPELLRWPRDGVAARVDDLLALVGLPPREYRSRRPSQLSGGEQQRVGLARALAADPGVLLMDEPFGALDAITRRALQDELLGIQQRLRKTVLFVTHDVEEALRLADEIVVLRNGAVVQAGTPLAVMAHPADAFVRELMGADDAMRCLSLVAAGDAMTPDALPAGGPAVAFGDDLRRALSLLLRTGSPALTVLKDGRPVGVLTLERIRAAIENGS